LQQKELEQKRKFQFKNQYGTNPNHTRNQHLTEEKDVVIQINKPFNPNTVTEAELLGMGLPKFLVQRIIKYRLAGGQFRTPESIEKIYGMDPEIAAELKPFVLIDDKNTLKTPKFEPKNTAKPSIQKFDLNTADTTDLMQIKGIGPTYARRIIAFRKKLGGFYNTNQVFETYGIDSAAVRQLQQYSYLTPNNIQTLAINKENSLAHPYLKPWVAKAIVAYRNQHGPFEKPSDLLQVKIMDPATLEKLTPYLSFTP
jgi:competence protein ComEA